MICLYACNPRPYPRRRPVAAAVALLACSIPAAAPVLAQMNVVATTPNLADIVKQIGGDLVSVQSVMRGPEDIHNVSPRPSHMMKLKKAQLFVHSGLDTELWAPLLVKGARNPKLLYGRPGNVDVSRGIILKEVPTRGGLTRALGDIHAYGNVHYTLDPLNGVTIARSITDAFKDADPANADAYEARCRAYSTRLRDLSAELIGNMKPYAGTPVVTYHRSWPYFLDRFGLECVGEVEPKPGIAPGPQHLQECIERMNSQGARVVIVETYNNKSNAEFVAARANGKAVVLAMEVNAIPGVDTYEELFRFNLARLLEAFQALGLETSARQGTTPTSGG